MGTERAQMMVDVMSKGIQNVVNDTLVSNTLEQKERIEKGEQENFNLQDLEKRKKQDDLQNEIQQINDCLKNMSLFICSSLSFPKIVN